MLKRIIKKYIIDKKDTDDILRISSLYLCRAIDTKEFREHIKPLVTNFTELKAELRANGYLHLNLKTWVFYCIKNGLKPKQAKLQMRHFDVKYSDYEVLCSIMKDKDSRELFEKFDKYKAHTLTRYKQLLADTFSKCEYYAVRFVNTKLVFLTMGSFLTKEDLTSELMMKAYDALLLQYPCIESKLHHENICRRAIHNFGLNTLYFYNGKGRANLMNNGDGTFTTTSYHYQGVQLEDSNNSDVVLDYHTSSSDESDKGISLDQLLKQYSGKERRFINMLAGNYDIKFSKYLSKRNMLPNDELYDKVKFDKYLDLVCDHLEISGYKAQTLMTNIRNQLEA